MGGKKITIQDVKQAKKDHRKIVMVTAYDYPFGLMADEAGVDIVLVGDSLGMVVMGLDGTVDILDRNFFSAHFSFLLIYNFLAIF